MCGKGKFQRDQFNKMGLVLVQKVGILIPLGLRTYIFSFVYINNCLYGYDVYEYLKIFC